MIKALIVSLFVTCNIARMELFSRDMQTTTSDALFSPQTMFHSQAGSCIPSGQCYMGNNPERDCCAKHVTTNVACFESAVCAMCKKVVGLVVNTASDEGCLVVIPEGVAICEVAGLGPEDPLADMCAAMVVAACPKIVSYIAQGITDAADICTRINMCGGDGSMDFSECNCIAAGSCTVYEAGCCSGSSGWSWGCVPPWSECN